MNDYRAMSESLAGDAVAQEIATEAAVQRLSVEQQVQNLGLDGVAIQGAEQFKTPKQVAPLAAYRAADLYGMELERTPMIVPGLLPVGLTVLAGAPKRGKSWLALSLGIAVSGGTTFLGIPCRRSPVLYLDLESRQYRVQDRLSKLIAGAAPDLLWVAHESDTLGSGLYEQMQNWVDAVGSPAVIIIDTLGRVKAGAKNRSDNAYEADTKLFGSLQKWAFDNRSAVLVIHHLRKVKESDDWFDRINGSNGLTGAADAVWGLGGARGDPVSRFMISGRDIDGDYEMAIRFDGGRWILEAASSEEYAANLAFTNDATVRGVYRLMQIKPDWQGTINELRDAIVEVTGEPYGVSAKDTEEALRVHAQRLYDDYHILAGYKKAGNRRVLHLRNRAAQEQIEINPGECDQKYE